ncbi:amidase signature enzyme, partial [Periconia macrospinosa]
MIPELLKNTEKKDLFNVDAHAALGDQRVTMPLDHATHSLAETVALGDRTYFFDRENAVWSLATLTRRLSSSSRASSLAWLGHSRGIGDATFSWKEIEPVTVVDILVTGDELGGERRVTFEELHGLFEKWRLTDDVWENGFLKNIHLQPKPTCHSNITINLTEDARYKLQTEHSTSNIFCGPASTIRDCGIRDQVRPSGKVEGRKDFHDGTSFTPSPGPYFVSLMDGRLMPAYRIYEDTYETFIQSTYSPSNGKNMPLPIHSGKLNHLSVAVPSRLQSQPTTPERPLAGLRFSVKDIFYIKGLGSPSLGSRAWVSIRDKQCLERQQDQEASNNKPVGIVEVLQNMGAVFVGKNKLSEFAFAGPYHWQNTDYLLNFNPRADGLQTPSDSSGGSASAVAAYDWLDFAIGTDTGGSVRLPADANGVYGGRPTIGAIDASSMQSLAKSLDIVGILARDPAIYCKVLRALLKSSPTPMDTSSPPSLPARLKVIVNNDHDTIAKDASLRDTTATADGIFETFVRKLETSLGVRRENVILDSLWEETKEEFSNSRQNSASEELLGGMGDEFGDLYRKIVYWESYRDLGYPFMKAYSKANDGRIPLVNNNAKAAWKTIEAGGISESMYREALAKKHMLKSWVNTYLTEGYSAISTLLVSRGSNQGEELRDT